MLSKKKFLLVNQYVKGYFIQCFDENMKSCEGLDKKHDEDVDSGFKDEYETTSLELCFEDDFELDHWSHWDGGFSLRDYYEYLNLCFPSYYKHNQRVLLWGVIFNELTNEEQNMVGHGIIDTKEKELAHEKFTKFMNAKIDKELKG